MLNNGTIKLPDDDDDDDRHNVKQYTFEYIQITDLFAICVVKAGHWVNN